MTPSYRYRCEVTRVVDGDTLEADVDLGFRVWTKKIKLRLQRVNCPEMNTDAGKAAALFVYGVLKRLAGGAAPVIAEIHRPDKYGNRWNATVWLPDGRCLNDLLVESGHAVPMNGEC